MLSTKEKNIILNASKSMFANKDLKNALVSMVKDFQSIKKQNEKTTFKAYVEDMFDNQLDLNNVKRMLNYYGLTTSGKKVKTTPKAVSNYQRVLSLLERLSIKNLVVLQGRIKDIIKTKESEQ